MIKEITTLFFVMLAVTIACFLGMFAAEGIINKMVPALAVSGATLWMALKIKGYQTRETMRGTIGRWASSASGWWNRATSSVTTGYEKTKRGIGNLIPFRHNPAQATS
jgi:hypothetical protein